MLEKGCYKLHMEFGKNPENGDPENLTSEHNEGRQSNKLPELSPEQKKQASEYLSPEAISSMQGNPGESDESLEAALAESEDTGVGQRDKSERAVLTDLIEKIKSL